MPTETASITRANAALARARTVLTNARAFAAAAEKSLEQRHAATDHATKRLRQISKIVRRIY
jgi:hypothetical protein